MILNIWMRVWKFDKLVGARNYSRDFNLANLIAPTFTGKISFNINNKKKFYIRFR